MRAPAGGVLERHERIPCAICGLTTAKMQKYIHPLPPPAGDNSPMERARTVKCNHGHERMRALVVDLQRLRCKNTSTPYPRQRGTIRRWRGLEQSNATMGTGGCSRQRGDLQRLRCKIHPPPTPASGGQFADIEG
jgi:hypothetical protein